MDGYLEPIENEPLKIPWPKSQESLHVDSVGRTWTATFFEAYTWLGEDSNG